MTFPAFRRMVGTRRYYRIASERSFTEVEVIGERRLAHHVEAKAYPEMLRISEMLACSDGVFERITAREWEREMEMVRPMEGGRGV